MPKTATATHLARRVKGQIMLFTIRYIRPGQGSVSSASVEANSPEEAKLKFTMGQTSGSSPVKPIIKSVYCEDLTPQQTPTQSPQPDLSRWIY